jgi:hypothetical protein
MMRHNPCSVCGTRIWRHPCAHSHNLAADKGGRTCPPSQERPGFSGPGGPDVIEVLPGGVIGRSLADDMATARIGRADLARGAASAAPAPIVTAQVVQYGVRYLAWLAKDDSVVVERLNADRHEVLRGYVPRPFWLPRK